MPDTRKKQAKSSIPKPLRRIIGGIAKGTLTAVEASTKLGSYFDKKLGTENKSLFRRSDPAKRPETYMKPKSKGSK